MPQAQLTGWDNSTDERFYQYYAAESASKTARNRFSAVRDCVLRVLAEGGSLRQPLDIADIGCGAGTACMMWAEVGHRAHGIDVNEPLVELGRKRVAEADQDIDLRVGSATLLPWGDRSMDVCIALELLEHIANWNACIKEFKRILRPGGVLFFTTTNRLCPHQLEFNLPLYSWYPSALKRYFERLSVTTRPEFANYAKYPAVNWFTFYGLKKTLERDGFRCLDRFDVVDLRRKGVPVRTLVHALRTVPLLRRLAHVCTSGTMVLAVKADESYQSA
jgi:2-polyprenyl-6-hydroxyphenyl methylase/3-demethylubiquinone-9 3-methyltransferase